MTISDEKLSAFLDGELPQHEMDTLREHIANDDNLAERLQTLAMLDTQVQATIKQIDEIPVPTTIQELAAKLDQRTTSGNVISLPLWKRAHQYLQHYAVAAATLAAVIGFILGSGVTENPQAIADWRAISQALETTAGGVAEQVNDNITVTNNLTFFNQSGEYCRQFSLNSSDLGFSQNIACRQHGSWKLKASIPVNNEIPQEDYQTASGPGPIDRILDGMMSGEVLSGEDEQAAINAHWPNLGPR